MQSHITITTPKLVLFFAIQIAILAILFFISSRSQSKRDQRITNQIELIQKQTNKALKQVEIVGQGLDKIDTVKNLLFIQLEIQQQALEINDKSYQLNRTKRRSKQRVLEAKLETASRRIEELRDMAYQFDL